MRRVEDDLDEGPLSIHDWGPVAGAMLKGQSLLVAPGVAQRPVDLPAEPYRSLGYYDVADRALFTGRDTDIVRFAATLDQSDTRILILQGESGIGKSSFLRAGVLPYLEEQCIGYRLLRRPNDEILIIQVAKDAIGQIAQGLLDATAEPLEYATPDGELVQINLRKTIDEALGRPADYPTLRAELRAIPACSRPCWPGWLLHFLMPSSCSLTRRRNSSRSRAVRKRSEIETMRSR